MPHDAFISHSSKDKTAADAVVAHLERAGIRCWYSTRDILPGSSWANSLLDAINQCRIMVIVFSANANESPHVRREIERAVSRGIPLVPVRIEDVLPAGELQYFLSTSHWLDAISPPLERHLTDLGKKLKLLLDFPATDQTDRATDPVKVISDVSRTPVIPSPINSFNAAPEEDDADRRSAESPFIGRFIKQGRLALGRLTRRFPQANREPGQITASELRAAATRRERAIQRWEEACRSIDNGPGFASLNQQGRSIHASMEAAFNSDDLALASDLAGQLFLICDGVSRVKSRRSTAEGIRDRAAGKLAQATALASPRLAAARMESAARFDRHATQAFQAADFELAVDHWREAERELHAAAGQSRQLRAEELKQFVERLAAVYRCFEDPTDEAVAQRTRALAEEFFVEEPQKEQLIARARALAGAPAEAPQQDVEVGSSNLDPDDLSGSVDDAQTLHAVSGSAWPVAVLVAYIIGLLGVLGVMVAHVMSSGFHEGARNITTSVSILSVIYGGFFYLPISVVNRRPARQKALGATMLVGLLIAAMVAAYCAMCSIVVIEQVAPAVGIPSAAEMVIKTLLVGSAALSWLTWGVIVYRSASRRQLSEMTDLIWGAVCRVCILALFFAVPAHLHYLDKDFRVANSMTGPALFVVLCITYFSVGPPLLIWWGRSTRRIARTAAELPLIASWTPPWLVAGVSGVCGALYVLYGNLPDGKLNTVAAVFAVIILVTTATAVVAYRMWRRRVG